MGKNYECLLHMMYVYQLNKNVVVVFFFFAFSNPMPDNDPIEIKPVLETNNTCIDFVDLTNNGPVAGQNPHAVYIEFWDEFLHKHNDILH